jgi:ABC-type branched-subunit amino acid transport system substrate-binding protein
MKTFGPPGLEINQTMVEGYLTAKTVVEALKRAGPNPTRKKVLAALESMKQFDAGGVIIGFTPANHTGSKFVELAIVLASGKLMR